MQHLRRIVGFAAVSGVGLAVDFAVFFLLIQAGLSPFGANAVSGACAVTFVYFASVRRIFSYRGHFLLGLFAAYLVYQVCGVTAASLLVQFLAEGFVSAGLAKILILPLTFTSNYLFMSLLTRKGAGADLPNSTGN
jgi:putative flippase GtrA